MDEITLEKFRCIRNANYHEDFERFYAGWHKRLMFLVVFLGTTALGISIVSDSKWALAATFVATISGLIDLLWDVDGKARLHSSLRRRSYDLLARIEAGEDTKRIKVEFMHLVADEPPPMHAANAIAFNAAVDALGRPPDQKYVLTIWQRAVRHWYPFEANAFPERS
jgi:hypothetical protein